jgi:hypothetical protein
MISTREAWVLRRLLVGHEGNGNGNGNGYGNGEADTLSEPYRAMAAHLAGASIDEALTGPTARGSSPR